LPAYSPRLSSAGLSGLHGPFDFVSQLIQMLRKAIEHFPLRFVSSQVPDKRAFGSVFAQLLMMR